MQHRNSRNKDANRDPSPNFPTDADIATAAQLWRQLERRYFSELPAPTNSTPQQSRFDEGR
jgi:hypothetical protein